MRIKSILYTIFHVVLLLSTHDLQFIRITCFQVHLRNSAGAGSASSPRVPQVRGTMQHAPETPANFPFNSSPGSWDILVSGLRAFDLHIPLSALLLCGVNVEMLS